MYAEMCERCPRRFTKLQVGSAAVGWVLIILVAVAGDFLYGLKVASNVLKDLPSIAASKVAQVAVIVVVSSMYPMVFYPVTAPLRQALRKKDPLIAESRRDCTFFAVCVAVDVLAGLTASTGVDLGTVNDYNGIIWLAWFTILVPALVYWHILRDGR